MLPTWYITYKDLINDNIKTFLDNYLKTDLSKPLNDFKEIIYYATSSGKRVRAILALETYLNLTGKNIDEIKQDDDIIKICIALEFIHAYSLIHDDLPCMDNDDFRRGQLTVWKKYGETNAVLCGDLLNTLTFEILSTINDNEKSKKLTNLISKATSIYGMIGGQIEDIYFENNFPELNIDLLKDLHNKKLENLLKLLSWLEYYFLEMISI
nr:polyprenyl synthetase family protein [Candidatus Gracilibacteria bacterium]